jgi:prevent-host-death family protein
MKISDVRSQLNALVNRIYRNEARVIIEKSGIPVAAVVPVADLERLHVADQRAQKIQDALDRMSGSFAGVPAKEVEREALQAAEEAKAALRKQCEETAAGHS